LNIAVRELDEVAMKFKRQLTALSLQAEQTGDLAVLRNRCRKAATYFHAGTVSRILTPLQRFLNETNLRTRAKTSYKHLTELESDVLMFLESMKDVRYNNLPLTDDLPLVAPARKDIFAQASKSAARTELP
jgi:hypothetical protein